MNPRTLKRFLAAMLVVGSMASVACGGGDGGDAAPEVGAERAAPADSDTLDSEPTQESGSVGSGDDTESVVEAQPSQDDDEEEAESTVGDFEESGAEGADGSAGSDGAADSDGAQGTDGSAGSDGSLVGEASERADEVTCAPVADGAESVVIGPDWTTDMAYDVVVFEGVSDPIANEFSASVVETRPSTAILEWVHNGAIVDGAIDDTDKLPTVAYFVSQDRQVVGLANIDEVREQAIAINNDLADEVSEEAAQAGRAMIEGLPEDALIALYASREVFFHSLDGYELTEGKPREFATTQPDAGGFGLEVPGTIVTQIETMANDAGCVVVTQTTEPNRDELEQVLDAGSPAGDRYTAETLPTFSSLLTAWVDGTTGEVRRMSRQETRTADGEDVLVATMDLFALDAE